MPASAHGIQNLGGLGARPQASHARVELQMIRKLHALVACELVELGQLLEPMDDRGQLVPDQRLMFERQALRHRQDAGSDACLPQRRPFGDVADRQPRRALRHQDARDLDSPMPISVGLHYPHHLDGRT